MPWLIVLKMLYIAGLCNLIKGIFVCLEKNNFLIKWGKYGYQPMRSKEIGEIPMPTSIDLNSLSLNATK
jgi:hypothetical protein